MGLTTVGGFIFQALGLTEACIISLYLLGVLLTAAVTSRRSMSMVAAAFTAVAYNFFFCEPRFTFHSTYSSVVTMLVSFVIALLTGTLAASLKTQAHRTAAANAHAQNEQMRANLLRAISHDLRTPLTTIAGNASNLMTNGARMTAAIRQQVYKDIYEESNWLIHLVENLLAVTRLEDGRMQLHPTTELVDDVIHEALRHIRSHEGHTITVDTGDDILLARMDVRLIAQVIVNLVDNAIKYTPRGSHIEVQAQRRGAWVEVRVADDGPGIPDEKKETVFTMFYTGDNKVADSRRSLGLGLGLCRSILNAHGGTITLTDNQPHGAVFIFTLPAGEVDIHE